MDQRGSSQVLQLQDLSISKPRGVGVQDQLLTDTTQRNQLLFQGAKDFSVPPPGKKREKLGFKYPKYPREEAHEALNSLNDVGGAFQRSLVRTGNCCGTCKAYCPCNPFVSYPYQIVGEGYQGLYMRFGRYVSTVSPGLIFINPCADELVKLDCKLQVIDCPMQQVMTKDNVMIVIDVTLYYRIVVAKKAYFNVDSITNATISLAQATIKSIAGSYIFQDLLEQRSAIQRDIKNFIEEIVWDWGVDVENVLIRNILLNQELQNTLSLTAQQKRAAQAQILQAQADLVSVRLMRQAADLLESQSAMQVRYLNTIANIGQYETTTILTLPTESEN